MTVPVMLAKFCPSGLLGIGITALMASFMSGMAGNVTAFNTVWTYDLYQSYIRPGQPDRHYLRMGHIITVVGILISVACAYVARAFNNIMDMLQLVFGFVNAPLFATFLLGMFWRRATGHGAFFGLLSGTRGGRPAPRPDAAGGRARSGVKGGWLVRRPRAAHLPGGHGAELLGRDLRLDGLFCRDHRGLAGHAAKQDRRRTAGPGVLADAARQRAGVPWYKQPALLGCRRPGRGRRAERDLLVSERSKRCNSMCAFRWASCSSIIGLILSVYGLVTWSDAAMYERSLGYNVNLWWGLFLTAFGAACCSWRRAAARPERDSSSTKER